MSMNRKDFELITRVINELRVDLGGSFTVGYLNQQVADRVAEKFANALVGRSSTFNRDRFLTACRPKEKS
jgi:hypothetical protein